MDRLFGKAEVIGATDLADLEREVWSGEAISTAAIEGETLNLTSVRSSVARRLGIPADFMAAVPRNVEGLLDVMENAAADWDDDLTKERLCRWQAALFPAEGTALRHIVTGRFPHALRTPCRSSADPWARSVSTMWHPLPPQCRPKCTLS